MTIELQQMLEELKAKREAFDENNGSDREILRKAIEGHWRFKAGVTIGKVIRVDNTLNFRVCLEEGKDFKQREVDDYMNKAFDWFMHQYNNIESHETKVIRYDYVDGIWTVGVKLWLQ